VILVAIDPFASPYTPNLVPQSSLEDDSNERIIALERFLSEELARVAEGITFVPVQAAYGAITVDPGPAPDQPLTKDVVTGITGFNNFRPDVPNRITVDLVSLTGDSLVPEEGGVYWAQAQLTLDIDSGTTYRISMAINGVVSSIFGQVDASNQTDIITMTLYGIQSLNQGDLVTLVAEATAAPAGPFEFIMLSATFSLVRVSEQHDERL
jgi:hypothetical protein